MKRLALIASVAAVIGVWPAASSAATFKGVVVAKQRGALLVASPAGLVRSATGSAAVGSRVVLSGGHATVVGRARTARIRGIVVRRVGTTVFLSSNSHLVAIHTARRLSSVSTNPPPITTTVNGKTTITTGAPQTGAAQTGAIVSSQVTINDNGELDEDSSQTVGQATGGDIPIQAVVSAVGAGTVTLTVGTQTLTVPLPAGVTLPVVGQTVSLSLSLGDQNGQNGADESNDDNGDDDSGTSGGGSDD
jgi:hypothetical protein